MVLEDWLSLPPFSTSTPKPSPASIVSRVVPGIILPFTSGTGYLPVVIPREKLVRELDLYLTTGVDPCVFHVLDNSLVCRYVNLGRY